MSLVLALHEHRSHVVVLSTYLIAFDLESAHLPMFHF